MYDSSVPVTWESNVSPGDLWFYEVQLDNGTVQNVGDATGQLFQDVAEGYHTLKVWVYNMTGAMAYDSEDFLVDLSSPSLVITSPANNAWLNTSTVNVTWAASDPSYISYFSISLNGQGRHDSTLLQPTNTSYSFNVLDGDYTVVLIAYDMAGKSTTSQVSFSVDTVAPTVHITSPDGAGFSHDNGFDHDDVTVTWEGSTGGNLTGYRFLVDGVQKSFLAPDLNARTDTRSYADGPHTVTVVAVDRANNTASDSVTFYVDTVIPEVVAHSPTGASELITAPIIVQFSKEMDPVHTNITVSGASGNISGTIHWNGLNATFVPLVQLQYGTSYTVTVTGRDSVGNGLNYAWQFGTTDMGTISGVIRDNDGNPLAGATVTLDDGQSVVTDAAGAYSFQAHAGAHTLTITKDGWDTRTIEIGLSPGQAYGVSDLSMAPSDVLTEVGIVAAIIAVVIVVLLVYFGYRRKKNKGPPANARSWKGAEELQKRSTDNVRSNSRSNFRSSRRAADDEDTDAEDRL